ncbi:MAG: UDP-N-acetylglucosamine 2-epimerase (non-hydrolyzing) [Bacteroidales bacterium]
MKKIVTVIGARPQFVKAAAVSRAIQKSGGLREIIVHTGQHFDENMSSVFFREMEIPEPDYNLQINSLSHGAMTGRMLEKIEEVLLQEKPDFLMVYGDTNSTIAGALAAKKLDIKVIHVEAGLRSFNMKMPEEINRILTDRISDLLFCPTDNAVHNLDNEGFGNFKCQIHQVGDVMYDAALFYSEKSATRSDIMTRLQVNPGDFILCTVHRQENTDNLENLKQIVAALNDINKQKKVILPLHPRTRKILKQHNIVPGFESIDPVGYFDMLELLKNCNLVMTDSGGMQKEAYFFKKYCITLRKETEWIELVNNHYNMLTGADAESIRNSFMILKDKEICHINSLYGDGNASIKIINSIINYQP